MTPKKCCFVLVLQFAWETKEHLGKNFLGGAEGNEEGMHWVSSARVSLLAEREC